MKKSLFILGLLVAILIVKSSKAQTMQEIQLHSVAEMEYCFDNNYQVKHPYSGENIVRSEKFGRIKIVGDGYEMLIGELTFEDGDNSQNPKAIVPSTYSYTE